METNTKIRGSLAIRRAGVSFRSGAETVDALRDITLDIEPGEFIAMLGPSGCGKSTLLGAIAGFNELTTGEILMDGKRPGRIKARVSVLLPRPRSTELLTSVEFTKVKPDCLDQVRSSMEPARSQTRRTFRSILARR